MQTLWFEYKQVGNWFLLKMSENRNTSNAKMCNTRAVLKLEIFELKSKYSS